VFTVLLANNRSVPRSCSGQADPRCPSQCQCRSSRGAEGCYLPHQIWLQVFTFANRCVACNGSHLLLFVLQLVYAVLCREWFCPPKSELQAVSMELAVERRLRRAAEDRLRRAEASCRDYERKLHGMQVHTALLCCEQSVTYGSHVVCFFCSTSCIDCAVAAGPSRGVRCTARGQRWAWPPT
jgi:hypothetical protein